MPGIISNPKSPLALYWRLHSLEVRAGFTAFLSEIEFAESSGGPNIASAGTPFGTPGGTVGLTFDGSTGTQSGANDGDAVHWGVQFPTPRRVAEVRLNAAFIPVATPTGFCVQRSNDGLAWETVAIHLAGALYTTGEWRTFPVGGLSLVAGGSRSRACGWRLNVADNDGGATLQISEIIFRAPGGASLISGGGPTAKNANSTGLTAANAFDGNTGTFWASGGADDFSRIGYMRPGIMGDCAEVSVRATTTPGNSPADFSVEYTTDGTTWVSVGSFTSFGWASGETRVFTL